MAASTSRADLSLQREDGTWLPLMLAVPRDDNGNVIEGAPKSVEEVLAASFEDAKYLKELAPSVQGSFSRGLGLDYNEAAGVYTRTDGYALPAGVATSLTLPGGSGATAAQFVAICEYQGDIFIAEDGDAGAGGRVLRAAGGGTTLTASLVLTAGEVIRDLCVFDDGAGNQYVYASSTDTSGANARLHRWNGTVWASTAAATFGIYGKTRMKRVFWTTEDGIGAWRLVVISDGVHIAYTLPNADPFLAASWVEQVKIVTDTSLDELAAARHHIWIGSRSDVHDLNEMGESPGLMGYENRTPSSGIRFPLQYFNDYVYRAGANTLDRIYVGEGATLQSVPGMCAPGWGTPAENEWRGYPTAFCIDQGFLVTALWNPTTGKTGIFWGFDHRGSYAKETNNPLLWFGPEIHSSDSRRVTAMMPSMLASGERRLWLASMATTRELHYVSLPIAGAPLQDLISAGTHRFATGAGTGAWNAVSRIQLMPEDYGDPVSKKIIYGLGTATRGLDIDSGTKLVLETRADPLPGATTWEQSVDVLNAPADEYVPTVDPVEGYKLERRYLFVSPDGDSVSVPKVAVLDGTRMTVWKVAPDFGRRQLDVEYGAGVVDLHNAPLPAEHIDPEAITRDLVVMTRLARTTLRTRDDRRWTVHLMQVLDRHETYGEGKYGGKKVRARLELAMIAALAADGSD